MVVIWWSSNSSQSLMPKNGNVHAIQSANTVVLGKFLFVPRSATIIAAA